MRSANILALVALALWAGLLWMGIEGMKGVVAQRVLGYPAPGQIDFYVGIPCAVIVAVGGVTLLANAAKRVWVASQLVSAAALVAMLPYLFLYSGGV